MGISVVSGAVALFVIVLGVVNWVTTEIVVTSVIFKDVRAGVDRLGARVEESCPRIGEKIRYFLKCPLCFGVWVGFIEALAFGGPLHPHVWWAAWAAFVANGLLYKGIGHLFLQLNAVFHNSVELLKQRAELTKREVEMLTEERSRSSVTQRA